MMTNVISSAFDTVTTVEQGVELLDIFMHLSTREVIKIYAIVHLVTSIVQVGIIRCNLALLHWRNLWTVAFCYHRIHYIAVGYIKCTL